MSEQTRDGELLRVLAKLVRKELLSEAEKTTVVVALTPLICSVARRTVERVGLRSRACGVAVEDAVQESWLIAWVVLPKFNPTRGDVFAFVRTVLRRRLPDEWKRHSDTRTISLTHPEAVADTSAAEDDMPPISDSEIQAARRVLRSASKKEKLMFKMRQDKRSHAEIASVLGISEKASRTRFHRLGKRIRAAAEGRAEG